MNNTPNIIGAEEGRPYSLTYNEQLLKIGTLNVKGFNALGKQLISFSIFRMEHHLDIIGLTETKTKKNENKILSKTKNTKKTDKKSKKNIYKNTNINLDNSKDVCIGNDDKISEQNIEKKDDDSIPERDFNNFYNTWWSGKNEHYQGAGVGLAIKKELAKRVYRTEYIDGRAILTDLQLKQNVKIRIIVLYMPADPKQVNERMSIINQIESWIKSGLRDNKSIILMGDLNADPEKLDKIINSNSNKKIEDKYKIILSLRSLGMFDSQTGIN